MLCFCVLKIKKMLQNRVLSTFIVGVGRFFRRNYFVRTLDLFVPNEAKKFDRELYSKLFSSMFS